jgi:hypothetical protein
LHSMEAAPWRGPRRRPRRRGNGMSA